MVKNKKELNDSYNNIETLSDMEHIRKRPGMYVGSVQSLNGENSNALIQLFQETISNSIDEAYSGFGDVITAIIHEDNSVTIKDKGRGIPYGENGQSAINAFTVLNSSGKFNSDSYANALGTNGVGIKCVTALSEFVDVEVKRSDLDYILKIENQKVKVNKVLKEHKKENKDTGTSITFKPDKEIFDNIINWDDNILINKIEQSAFLTPKVKFIFIDERKKDENGKVFEKEWYSENGMSDYVKYIAEDEELIKGLKEPISFKGETKDKDDNEISVEGALIYTENYGETIMSFVNGGPTVDGGPHVDGAHQAILKAFNDYGKDEKILKSNQKLEMSDVTEGLILSLLVKLPENIMMFESQSKTKLSTVSAKPATFEIMYSAISNWLYDNKKTAKNIIDNMKDAKEAREAAVEAKKTAKEARKNKNNQKLVVSEKLRRASCKDPELLELILTEGNSACQRSTVKIRLADGTNPTIKEMTERFNNGEKLYVYSNNFTQEDNDHELDIDESLNKTNNKDNGLRVVPVEWVGVTRKNAELVRVYIDNDTYVDCTPDHKFLMLDGTYKEAQDLQSGESLSVMPYITRENKEGYYLDYHNYPVHRQVALQYYTNQLEKGLNVHHKNGKKQDNRPENLEILTRSEHSKKTVKEMKENGSFYKMCSLGGRNSNKNGKLNRPLTEEHKKNVGIGTSKGMAKMSKEAKKQMRYNQLKTMTLSMFKKAMKDGYSLEQIKDCENIYANYDYVDKNNETKMKDGFLFTKFRYKYNYNFCAKPSYFIERGDEDFLDDEKLLKAIQNSNHCVVKVEKLDVKEDVYDIKVPHVHNFCLANDVFVHNCGSVTKTRDSRFQSVFPLKGKILNVQEEKMINALKNKEISTIAQVLGAGIGPSFDIKDLAYDKVIIATDEDDDGFHIRALLITLFYNLFPGLIENGHVYIVDSPLFINTWYVKGERKQIYTYSIEEQNEVAKDLDSKKINYDVQRNKGLGELSLEAAEKSLTNPKTRKLTRVTVDDAIEVKRTINILMGKSSKEKKDWIIENVKFSNHDEYDDLLSNNK